MVARLTQGVIPVPEAEISISNGWSNAQSPTSATFTPCSKPCPYTSSQPAFFGNGFPGLPPVDFSKVAKLPLPMDMPMGGAITPTGGEILGFTLDAKANDTLDLSFTRVSGNLNLGLVVLSADNKVIFQASLVTSKTLSTQFMFPAEGQYTIGVFRVDLLPPAKPEATAFQIVGKLVTS